MTDTPRRLRSFRRPTEYDVRRLLGTPRKLLMRRKERGNDPLAIAYLEAGRYRRDVYRFIARRIDEPDILYTFDNLTELRASLYKSVPHLQRIDEIAMNGDYCLAGLQEAAGSPDAAPFVNRIADFYLTNPIARASAILAELSALKAQKQATGQLHAAE